MAKFHGMSGFIDFFRVIIDLRQFWPTNFKTWMVPQQLKNKKLKPLECPSVPGGRSEAKSGARSVQQRLGRPACHPKGFKFGYRVSCMPTKISSFLPIP